MDRMSEKLLFSVVQDDDGAVSVNWNREFYPYLDEMSANGEFTDEIIDLAESFLEVFKDLDDDVNETAA